MVFSCFFFKILDFGQPTNFEGRPWSSDLNHNILTRPSRYKPHLFYHQDMSQRTSTRKRQLSSRFFPHHNSFQYSSGNSVGYQSHFPTPRYILELDMVAIFRDWCQEFPKRPEVTLLIFYGLVERSPNLTLDWNQNVFLLSAVFHT